MKRRILVGLVALLLSANVAHAHVTVKPNEIGVGERTNFVVSVPTEENTPTIKVRLIIPEGVESVRPNVKPGWTIDLVKSGEGEDARITEIIWSGGSIPTEQKDEFVFSAQAPAEEGTLAWKAYQTYGSGSIIAWDSSREAVEDYTKNNPTQNGHHSTDAPKPYSETAVINDLAASNEEVEEGATTSTLPLVISVIALIGAGASIAVQLKRRG